jgi:ATP-dependent RNA helicase DDX18/HAS1
MLEETVKVGKVKKIKKNSVNVGLSEVQNGDVSENTVENGKVKKSPQKSTILTNGETTTQSPNSESKKKKKKKRKMVNDAEPGKYLIFFGLQPFIQFFTSSIPPSIIFVCT